MRGTVERSQSLRADYNRSKTDSPNSLRPKVSFNRAVHIKRISRKERLPKVPEDEDSVDYAPKMASNGIKSPSKFSTMPSRRHSNGVKKSETPAPSDRLSRLIKQEPKPEDAPVQHPPTPTEKKSNPKKKTLGERVRGIFSTKKSKPEDQQKQKEDDLKTRYTEFKGRNSSSDVTDNEGEQYSSKRRGSAPETRSSWFRSIDRLKKTDTSPRKERYFGESDRDSTSPRRRFHESSAESGNELESMGRAPSLVYLHTAAVGDIPHRAATPTRRLSRSVSVLAPWAPKTRPPRGTRSRATQTDSPKDSRHTVSTTSLLPPRQPTKVSASTDTRGLPKLVFTGPSIEETVGKTAATSTIQRSSVHVRTRK